MSKAAKVQKYRVHFLSPSRHRWIESAFSRDFQGEPLTKLVKAVQGGANGGGFRYRILKGRKVVRQIKPQGKGWEVMNCQICGKANCTCMAKALSEPLAPSAPETAGDPLYGRFNCATHGRYKCPECSAPPTVTQDARGVASKWVYGVHKWRGMSPAYMQTQVGRLAALLTQFAQDAREPLHEAAIAASNMIRRQAHKVGFHCCDDYNATAWKDHRSDCGWRMLTEAIKGAALLPTEGAPSPAHLAAKERLEELRIRCLRDVDIWEDKNEGAPTIEVQGGREFVYGYNAGCAEAFRAIVGRLDAELTNLAAADAEKEKP